MRRSAPRRFDRNRSSDRPSYGDRNRTGGGGGYSGGGILLAMSATLTATDSTVASNISSQYGGGIFGSSFDTITLTHCTVANNTATSGGGKPMPGPPFFSEPLDGEHAATTNATAETRNERLCIPDLP